MLEIYANNKRLQLPSDIEVNMTWESPFLLQDRIPAPYSLSFTLPGTTSNLAVFGNPQRLASKGEWKEIPAYIRFNGVTFTTGKLSLSESDEKLKVNYIGSKLLTGITDSLGNLDLARYDFGETDYSGYIWGEEWASNYRSQILELSKNSEEFCACPVKIEDEEWGNYRYNTGYLYFSSMYFNMMNCSDSSYVFDDADIKMHASVFPQPFVKDILDIAFSGLLVNNPFREGELAKLAIVSFYHPAYNWMMREYHKGMLTDNFTTAVPYDYQTSDPVNYIKLQSFLGNYAFNDFLKNLLKIFCFSLFPNTDGTWSIVPNKEVLAGSAVLNWNNKIAATPAVSLQEAEEYGYGYSDISGSEAKKSTVLNDVKTLMTVGEGTFTVKTTGEVYEKKLRSKTFETDPDEYELKQLVSGLEGSDDGEYNMKSDVPACCMQVSRFWNTQTITESNYWYTPLFAGDRYDKTASPPISFFRGWINVGTGNITDDKNANAYPFMSAFPYDWEENKIGQYSLAWEGNDGLLTTFHLEFKEYIEKDKLKLTGYFLLTELDLKNLDWTKKIFLRGKKFYLNKIETTLKKRSIGLSKCELIEA